MNANLPENLLDVPEEIRGEMKFWLSQTLNRANPQTYDEARDAIVGGHDHGNGYLLRMHWLGRTDKYGFDMKPVFEWIDNNLAPPADAADMNNRIRCVETMEKVFALYEATPGVNLPSPAAPEADQGIFERLRGMFGR